MEGLSVCLFLMGINGAVLHLSSDVAKLEKSTVSDKDDERCGLPFILEVISYVKTTPSKSEI